jgi:hypothetical protein
VSWFEKPEETVFDRLALSGLFFLDGDVLSLVRQRPWTLNMKYPMVMFPSGSAFPVWHGRDERVIVHLFGEMDLYLHSDCAAARVEADEIASAVGYLASQRGHTQLELVGQDAGEHLLVTYDNALRLMVDVVILTPGLNPFQAPLLDEAIRARLPKLRATEAQGFEAIAQVAFTSPDSGWCWYATEFDGEDICFGLVVGYEVEYGNFTLSELARTRGPLGLPVERDQQFKPQPVGEIEEFHLRQRAGGR